MEALKEYLLSKYFSNFGYVVAALHVPALMIFAAVTGQLRTSERRTFRCDVADCRDDCLKKYDEQYNSPLPLYAFAPLCFVPSLVVCIAYSWCCVKSRVDEMEAAMKPDPERPRRRPRVNTRRVFCCYFLHLLVRFVLGISFAVLQNSVFYASNTFYSSVFPTEFTCYTANSTNLNVTNIDLSAINCDNSVGSDNATWAKGIWIVNILFAFLVFGELCYLLVRALKSNAFSLDSEFCLKNFFNKRRTPVTLRDSFFLLRRRVRKETEYLEPLIASGGETNDKEALALDDIYVDLMIYPERAEHKFHDSLKRHEIYDIYLQPKQGSVPIEKLGELLLPNKDTEDPRRILIVGCPGIGKSLLCKKLSRDWSKNELSLADSAKTFKHFYLFQFRWFNSGSEKRKMISLKQLLSRDCSDEQINYDDLFQDILDSPERVLLVFDGLDEFQHRDSCLEDEQAQGGNGPTEEMYFSALYIKLVKGKQLSGATVVTTCRPNVVQSVASLTFDRVVEIMGFTKEKVQEYVCKFCAKRTQAMNRIWVYLSSNLDLLSLCYIPVNSFIICSLLEKWITLEEQDSESTLPKTTTKVYTGALRLFIFKHHPEYKGKTLTKDYLMGNIPFSDSIEETLHQLGSLAKAGIEARQLIFGSTKVQGMENCGLLNRLPDREVSPCCFAAHFCFIHLTIQELLAAREIAKMSASYIFKFISSNASDPKWQLVIQFVAGYLREMKKEKGAMSSVMNSFVSHLHDALTAGKSAQIALLMLKCLYEYNDETVVNNAVSELHRDSKFDNSIRLSFCQVTFVDCTAIAYFVKHLVEPTRLNLGYNSISNQGLFPLCETLKNKNCKLTQLSLCANGITDQGLLTLCKTLENENCNLTQLDLSENRITEKGLLTLCKTLENENCKLTQLSLSGNKITDQGLLTLCKKLENKNCKLTQLDLSHNSITDQGLLTLCDTLENENCKLTQLNLTGDSITDLGLFSLCETLKNENCKLTQLNLCFNCITDQGLLTLSKTLIENCKLTQLNLSYNYITELGLFSLCKTLENENCKLTHLNFSYNCITDQDLLPLCKTLENENCKLTQLDLSANSTCITDQGLLPLCKTLENKNCKLTQLDLSHNSITDQGLFPLCETLENENCKLTQLDLSYNSITDQGLLPLCKTLENENCKLTQLNLSGNSIRDQGLFPLCKTLENENCKLTQLDLCYNSITDQGKSQVFKAQINTQCKVML